MTSSQPIAVVGGGIAGLNVALRLLRAGHAVTLFEKQRGPIDKVCGEGVLPFGVKHLEDLGLAVVLRQLGAPFHGIEYRMGTRRVAGSFADGEHGIGISRFEIDRLFRARCAAFDAFERVEGRKVTREDLTDFAQVIAADGVHSPLARACGRRVRMGRRLGVRFRVQAPAPPRVRVSFFDFGEMYITPVAADAISVAMLLEGDRVPHGKKLQSWCMTQFQRAFPEYDGAVDHFATRGHIVASFAGPRPDFHLVGDALHTFDPISGAGMSAALAGGAACVTHLHDARAYFQAMAPLVGSVRNFTRVILAFRGGGLRTRLMLARLGRAPTTFDRILALHDGVHQPWQLGLRAALPLLRPW
ncbi:NAD(P)/FAD-dependent oxidoreductase [Acanthopleuribacter pedis]|uniref:FAD-dependent monooxygenase n=1 Tax=Acanthopleuribacter pedis TaxID=442870 RepID=A0A8J7QDK4_9BACT|nr:NAD(P)/FAD-dependent oxidoreductase [Acanthopleuribacter pedis]MBO1317645.1 FAD-dependent monooxygenase [Acanthopleuribacter pedis]